MRTKKRQKAHPKTTTFLCRTEKPKTKTAQKTQNQNSIAHAKKSETDEKAQTKSLLKLQATHLQFHHDDQKKLRFHF